MARFTFVAFLLLISTWAQAHPLDLGYLTLTSSENRIQAAFELNPLAAQAFLKTSPVISDQASLSLQTGKLFSATLGRSEIDADEKPCIWKQSGAQWMNEQQIRITGEAHCPNRDYRNLELKLPFLKMASSTYQILGKVIIADQEHSFLAEPKNPVVTVAIRSDSNAGIFRFVQMGIEHIGAAPSQWMGAQGLHLPDGIDHILFLLALILGGGGLLTILKTATGFTLGHSVTLALASFGLVRLPTRLVESAIALSIVFVAVEVLLLRQSKSRWKVAALFGLVHGFGFASALQELALGPGKMAQALFGFNFGVEIGQALIILAIIPLLMLTQTSPRFHRLAVQCGAGAISMAGSYWFVLRSLGWA